MEVKKISRNLGAEVTGVNLQKSVLTDSEFRIIEAAWHEHSVLLFRDQHLTDDDLLAFSRRFGELDPPPNQENGQQSPPGYPEVYVVSNVLDSKGASIGALGSGELVWHTDMSYLELPPVASMLYSLEIPSKGGETSFTSMSAAFQALPAILRVRHSHFTPSFFLFLKFEAKWKVIFFSFFIFL
jgi:taurine dioxygenase